MAYEDISSPLPPRRPIEGSNPTTNQAQPPLTTSPTMSTSENVPTSPPETGPKPLPVKSFKLSPVFLIIGVVILVAGGALWGLSKLGGTKTNVTLNYWGLWENNEVLQGIFDEYEKDNPGVKINYIMSAKNDYRTRLVGRLEKSGDEVPDIFRIHSSWLPMFRGKLAPVPAEVRNTIGLENDYYETVKEDLKEGGNYYAVPLMHDQMAMYYNKDLIESAGVAIPKTWWELQNTAKKLTVVDDKTGTIRVAGAGLGLTDNVDHWSDIVGLMLKQAGADPLKNDETNAKLIKDTLTFYTYFKTQYKVWDESLPSTTELFANGKLAFYFAPSWRAFNLDDMKVDGMRYEIAEMPQLATNKDAPADAPTDEANLTNIHWSTYWAEAVNSKSSKQAEAWKLIEYMSSKEVLEKMHTSQSQIRAFGEIYPKKSMASELLTNTKIAPFVKNANNSTSWYLCSRTWDDGLNQEMSKYFGDAINAMVYQNKTSEQVWTDLKNGINQIVTKYSLKK